MSREFKYSPNQLFVASTIRILNPKAASYYLHKVPKLKSFVDSQDLAKAFDWDESEQGWEFWARIYLTVFLKVPANKIDSAIRQGKLNLTK